jgi:TonB-dependent SusC/RagA subfamily outer membrane receptor
MKKALALKGLAFATLWAFVLSRPVGAQQAVSVSGHVSGDRGPIDGASVRVPSLDIERTTDRNGYYSFLIPARRVGGQTVVMTVSSSDRRDRFEPQSVEITLSGGPIVRDFVLRRVAEPSPREPSPAGPVTRAPTANVHDTLGLGELAGGVGIGAALGARFPSVGVVTSSALGGSTAISYRGIRSFLGSAQPLFVVDGIIQDNTTFASLAQRYGAGGFDYGSPIQDLNTRDIATVRWMAGPEASARYGSRAANGVVVVTTKNARDGAAFAVGASQQFTTERVVKLPAYQNAFGQGLGGQFQFFDGQGHGVNDDFDQNWGPALDGRPLPQASNIEPRQADVRFWNAQPNNVERFFRDASTTNTDVTVQARSTLGALWLGLGQRQSDGVTPAAQSRRRDVRLTASTQAAPALALSATFAFAEMRNDDAPGSGFNQTNAASQLTRLGRQVSMDSLRAHVRTADGEQLSWNYAGQNNPFFSVLANDNARQRSHLSGGASATYAIDSSLSGTVIAGTDYYRDDRHFTIAPDWMGGFPFYASDGLFTGGGFQDDDVAAQRSNGSLRLDKTRMSGSTRWSLFAAADVATIHQRARVSGIDSIQNIPDPDDTPPTASAPAPAVWTGHGRTLGLSAGVGLSYRDRATLGATLRHEWLKLIGEQSAGETYPAVQASLDVAQYAPALKFGGAVDAINLHAGWWRSGTDATPYAIQTMYAGQALSGGVIPIGAGLLSPESEIEPETTDAWQAGADFSTFGRRLDAGFNLYYEHASNVLLPRVAETAPTVVANAAKLRNHGVEGFASWHGGDRDRSLFWDLGGTASLNYNRVEDLGAGVNAILVGPEQYGVSVQAIKGLPFGELLGFKLRRDPATGALLLRDGLPQADSAAGRVVLGQSRQNKLIGFRGTVGYRWVSLSAAAEGHLGGSMFSATHYNGAVAGSFVETASRPDSGILISGIDIATGEPNTTHVSTEAYYHALGAVQEPWIHSATFFKLRELSVSLAIPTRRWRSLPFESARLSLIGRNLYTRRNNPNFDPETLLSAYSYPGLELGQLPTVRSIGVQLSVTP